MGEVGRTQFCPGSKTKCLDNRDTMQMKIPPAENVPFSDFIISNKEMAPFKKDEFKEMWGLASLRCYDPMEVHSAQYVSYS